MEQDIYSLSLRNLLFLSVYSLSFPSYILSNFSLTIFLLLSRLSFLFLLFLFLQFFLSKLSSFNPSLFLLLCSFLSLFILNFHLFSFLFYLTYILPINLSSFSWSCIPFLSVHANSYSFLLFLSQLLLSFS